MCKYLLPSMPMQKTYCHAEKSTVSPLAAMAVEDSLEVAPTKLACTQANGSWNATVFRCREKAPEVQA